MLPLRIRQLKTYPNTVRITLSFDHVKKLIIYLLLYVVFSERLKELDGWIGSIRHFLFCLFCPCLI